MTTGLDLKKGKNLWENWKGKKFLKQSPVLIRLSYLVIQEIRKIKPHIFANGGDRKPDWYPIPEVALCEEFGIKMIYNVGRGGKVRSSSELVKKYSKHLEKYAKKN